MAGLQMADLVIAQNVHVGFYIITKLIWLLPLEKFLHLLPRKTSGWLNNEAHNQKQKRQYSN
jgi:hypothetical protein